MRDCLNEEITQALGPANDLYRLPDSIWNDDNFHGMATPFDMTILRALYQPELRSGMTRAEAAAVLPGARPGQPEGPRPAAPAAPARSRGPGPARSRRRCRATRRGPSGWRRRLATQIAAEMRPVDHRLGVSLLTLGRLSLRRDPAAAARNFAQAYDLFRSSSAPDDLRTAQAGVHLAALALGTGQYDAAIALADRHVPAARAGQNAILLAGLLSIKAEALAELGQAGGGAGGPPRQPALGALWLRRHRRGAGPRAGAARGAAAPREGVRPMLLPLAFALGALVGWRRAARRGGDRLDRCSTARRTPSPSRSPRSRAGPRRALGLL